MTTMYYVDSNGTAQTADLSIIDTSSGCHCECDILGNMDITGSGNVHSTPDDAEDCENDIQRGALATNATFYADDADAAQWWIDYVTGYNATQNDCDALRDELKAMDYDVLRSVVAEYLGEDRANHLRDDEMVYGLIESLHEGANDYETERSIFVDNVSILRSVIDTLQR